MLRFIVVSYVFCVFLSFSLLAKQHLPHGIFLAVFISSFISLGVVAGDFLFKR